MTAATDMKEKEAQLLGLDYLVYSSYKTGTRTTRMTLRNSRFRCYHCHYFRNLGVGQSNLAEFVGRYVERNGKSLPIITVFREPMERHISSFFQEHAVRPLRMREVEHESETLISRLPIEELQDLFVAELRERSMIGYWESMLEMSLLLGVPVKEMFRQDNGSHWLFDDRGIRLHIFRFEVLFEDVGAHLSRLAGKDVNVTHGNISGEKWYRQKYLDFKKSLTVPDETLIDVYNTKRDIIEEVYAEGFEAVLDRARERYGRNPSTG